MVEERWVPVVVPEFEDLYEVSDQGSIRRTSTKRVLKPGNHPRGYLSAVLSGRGIRTTVLLHRVVLEAFTGPCPEGEETRHGNGIRTDNRLENLSWGTSAQNEEDKRRHGTHQIGERNGMSKFSEEQVREIQRRYADGGESQRTLAAAYGCSQGTISRLVTGVRWGHLG